jgi:hypothetical protein
MRVGLLPSFLTSGAAAISVSSASGRRLDLSKSNSASATTLRRRSQRLTAIVFTAWMPLGTWSSFGTCQTSRGFWNSFGCCQFCAAAGSAVAARTTRAAGARECVNMGVTPSMPIGLALPIRGSGAGNSVRQCA